MRRRTLILAGGLWLLGAAHASACTPPPGEQYYPNRPADYLRFARATLAEATFVEVVEVQEAIKVTAPDAWDRWLATVLKHRHGDPSKLRARHKANRHKPVGVRFRLKVIERLKGRSPDTIFLNGGGVAPRPTGVNDGEFQHRIENGKMIPRMTGWSFDELELPDGPIGNSCMPGKLHLTIGQRYLVFRGPNGRLLYTQNGYRLVALDSSRGARNWFAAVKQAARRR